MVPGLSRRSSHGFHASVGGCQVRVQRMLPGELQELLNEIDVYERQAETLVADLSQDEVNWQPDPGRSWSVAQCLDHLTVMNEFYPRTFPRSVADAKARGVGPFAGLHPGPVGRWFVASMGPQPRFKLKSPKQAVPRATLRRDALVPAFKASHDIYRALVHAAGGVDVNKVTGRNPFLPFIQMRVATILLIIPAHDRRHLWQAENVKRAIRGR